MKLRRSEFYKIMDGIISLKEEKIDIKTAYTIIKNYNIIEKERIISDEIRNKLVQIIQNEYALKAGDEFIKANNVFGLEIIPEQMEEAMKKHTQYNQHLNEEIYLDIKQIYLSDINNIEISLSILSDIDKMIRE